MENNFFWQKLLKQIISWNFLFYQNIICFDWVMNLFLSWVMFFVKKLSYKTLLWLEQLHPWKFHQIVLDPLDVGGSKANNQDPWKFHIIFSWSPFEIPPRF